MTTPDYMDEQSNHEEALVPALTDADKVKQFLTEAPVAHAQTLRDSVEVAMSNYFSHLDGQQVSDVYQMVLTEVEAPLLEAVMKYTRNNQTKASVLLGLNRGTLRKKLKQYGLL